MLEAFICYSNGMSKDFGMFMDSNKEENTTQWTDLEVKCWHFGGRHPCRQNSKEFISEGFFMCFRGVLHHNSTFVLKALSHTVHECVYVATKASHADRLRMSGHTNLI